MLEGGVGWDGMEWAISLSMAKDNLPGSGQSRPDHSWWAWQPSAVRLMDAQNRRRTHPEAAHPWGPCCRSYRPPMSIRMCLYNDSKDKTMQHRFGLVVRDTKKEKRKRISILTQFLNFNPKRNPKYQGRGNIFPCGKWVSMYPSPILTSTSPSTVNSIFSSSS